MKMIAFQGIEVIRTEDALAGWWAVLRPKRRSKATIYRSLRISRDFFKEHDL
ncbi:hypothetical protein QUF76_13045 [Desulfobacterales bacterium HSG16]|nr:hypothetical protein [Desulfobacterales bacterium HSG16]